MSRDSGTASFVDELHWALHYLYDPARLGKSPLVVLFGLDQGKDPPAALRRLLTEAVEALKPGQDVPLQASAWRIYHVLFQRYVEQFTQREVAMDLGLSARQLRRQETLALRVLADRLAAEHGLELAAHPLFSPGDRSVLDGGTPSREQELEWLRKSLPADPVDLAGALPAVLRIVAPLTQALRVRLEPSVPEQLPRLAVPEAMLRQALLNLLMAAIRCVPGGSVRLTVETRRGQVCLSVVATRQHAVTAARPEDHAEHLAMARELVAPSGGLLEVEPGANGERPFSARLILPTAELAAVLVIDDNADTLQLLERYLAGSRYRFQGASDPEQALALAGEIRPQIIVLDVMLPGVDGWEILGRLREHPKTRGVPIVVCTILPQEQLALGLGAAAFLRKPVMRAAFLAALDRVLDPSH